MTGQVVWRKVILGPYNGFWRLTLVRADKATMNRLSWSLCSGRFQVDVHLCWAGDVGRGVVRALGVLD